MRSLQVPLYLFNNFQIIMIVWQTLSYSRHKLLEQEPYDILLAIMGAIGQVRDILLCCQHCLLASRGPAATWGFLGVPVWFLCSSRETAVPRSYLGLLISIKGSIST
jgi:hypothetical protein